MRKFVFALSLLLASVFVASAQFVNFRVEGAPAFSLSSVKAHGLNVMNSGTKVGYHFGAYVDVPVSSGVYLGSGLTFAMKGNKFSQKEGSVIDEAKALLGIGESNEITMHYLQVPVNIGYKLKVSPGLRLGIQTGPYFAAALGGTYKRGVAGVVASYNIFKEGVTNITAKRFDFGWGAAAMLYLGSYYATVGADFGLLNVSKESNQKPLPAAQSVDFRNTQVYIGLGYSF
ncbi:porin family protein [Porphyromonas circumdentaria]|uniref:Outer membrane protein beta-barrel domain-containing protein n=1 Tax=Porphyromonas circumdentaria TaxID=29524 RepID=A0A1T4P5R5_9PORP|nr:porin family protein [Porphyromonas circumdentaria]MBB6276302.1 hypothetical protein [Porphyromonas circumdentaria]MDO4722573.1 porin family protein [Porphyromonas circumdentaria]SJZ86920.1 Outer membrane protein beta-barrel domain-containing protein [Porphyromonas circumdentaria]